jgi:hypothetical protein
MADRDQGLSSYGYFHQPRCCMIQKGDGACDVRIWGTCRLGDEDLNGQNERDGVCRIEEKYLFHWFSRLLTICMIRSGLHLITLLVRPLSTRLFSLPASYAYRKVPNSQSQHKPSNTRSSNKYFLNTLTSPTLINR